VLSVSLWLNPLNLGSVISGISRIVIPCPIALLVSIVLRVPIVMPLFVIARLARVVGVVNPREFIKGSAPAEHGEAKECENHFHNSLFTLAALASTWG